MPLFLLTLSLGSRLSLTRNTNSLSTIPTRHHPRIPAHIHLCRTFVKSDKGEVTLDYDVSEDTYIYVYATDTQVPAAESPVRRAAAATTDNYIKIYSLAVNPVPNGIEDIMNNAGAAPVTGYYTIDGVRVNKPAAPGVYVVRRADGSTAKILVR